VRLAAKQISSSSFLSAVSAMLFRTSQFPLSSAMLQRTASATLCTAVSPPFNLHRARVRRNHGRLPSNGFIERAKSTAPASRLRQNARPIKHQRHLPTIDVLWSQPRIADQPAVARAVFMSED